MTRRATLLTAALAAALGLGAWHVWQDGSKAPVATAVAAPPAGVGALGRVEPASRVRKLSQPGGFSVNRVEQLLVAEGDRVEAGQVLAVLSDAVQKDAAVLQAEAALAEAQSTLQKIRAAGRPSEIAAQRARIAALAAVEDMNRRDALRSEELVPSGAGARAAAERNRAAAARAAAERVEAEAQLETLSHPRPEDVAVAEAGVKSAAGTLARARADAALSRITAPIAGTILKIYARAGDLIGSDGLLDLADLDRMDIVADVYETDLPRLRTGQDAQVIVPGETRRFTAQVREIGWMVRRTTQAGSDPVAAVDARTVEVRLTLGEDGRDALRNRTNMQVQVAIRP
ncbi:MAG: HlyD family efflux transporter periplasmic adaptor subunit [Acetobacteraceae bacterium]